MADEIPFIHKIKSVCPEYEKWKKVHFKFMKKPLLSPLPHATLHPHTTTTNLKEQVWIW